MMHVPRTLTAALMVLGAAGCQSGGLAPKLDAERAEREDLRRLALMLDQTIHAQRRLGAVGHRLTTAAAGFCGNRTRPYYGVNLVGHPRDVGRLRHREIYRDAFSLGDGFTIVDLMDGGPAADAGLRAGDVIVAVAGDAVAGPTDRQRLSPLFAGSGGTLAVDVIRDRGVRRFDIEPVPECALDVRLGGGNAVAVDAAAGHVLITPGMVRFAASDDELAIVVAHALARALQQPAPRAPARLELPEPVMSAVGAGAGTIDIASGARRVGATAAVRADRLGLRLAAHAGYDVGPAARFWRRLAVAHPRAVQGGRTVARPDLAKRLAAIEQTVRGIEAWRRNGGPLLPDGTALARGSAATGGVLADPPHSVRGHAIIAARQSREPFQRLWGRARSVRWGGPSVARE